MKRLILTILLLAASAGLAAEIDSIIARAPGADAYPDAGALVLLDRRVVTVDKDNKATTERWLVVKIFEDRGREDWGELAQRYDKDGQVCELLTAQTRRPDGTVVKPEARAISDVSAPEVAEAMAYTNAMQRIVSFPALEKNAVIEYHIRLKPRKSAKDKFFSTAARFGGYYPALRRELVLNLPAGVKWNWQWVDPQGLAADAQPKVESTATGTTCTWALSDCPRIRKEPSSPDLDAMAPRLFISSCPDWQSVEKEMREPFEKALVASPAVRALAAGLSAGKSRPDAMRDIYLWVTKNIRNVDLDYGDVGYEPHKPQQVLDWKYGDCRDKNCLLITLLREAGIAHCFPVVLSRDQVPIPGDVPCSDGFDWLCTHVTIDGEQYVLDPFAEYAGFGTLDEDVAGSEGLYLDNETFTPVVMAEHRVPDECSSVADLTLGLDGAVTGTVASDCSGCFGNWVRSGWRDRTPVERTRGMAQVASYLCPGATCDSFWFSDLGDLAAPVRAFQRLTAPRYAAVQKGEISLQVPMLAIAPDPVLGAATRNRQNPLYSPPARRSVYECRITLPAGLKVDYLPDPYFKENEFCSGSARWEKMPGGVVYRQEFALKYDELDPEAYDQLQSVTDALQGPQLREIYFLR